MDKRTLFFVLALTVALYFVHQWFSSKDDERIREKVAQKKEIVVSQTEFAPLPKDKEQFYILENDYQQLVFSNIGGALAEINLPFKSSRDSESVVRPIKFDRIMEKDYPSNDRFPAFSAQRADGVLEQGRVGGYYPLLRRTLFSNSTAVHRIPPQYYALNITSQDPETATLVYKVRRFEKNLIEFEATESYRKIIKTFSIPQDPNFAPYCIDLTVKIEGDARGLFLTSGVPEVELISGSYSPALKYRLTRSNKGAVEQLDLPKASVAITSVQPDWVCNSNGFFGLILDPRSESGSGFNATQIPGKVLPTRLSLIDAEHNLYPMEKYPGYQIELPLRVSNQATDFRIFAGPFDNALLKQIDATFSNPATGYNPNYVTTQSFHGWFSFISEPFAKFLFILMKLFYQFTHSWGISIILLTIALRIMLYPLNAWSIKSTTKMQLIAPQVSAIQERHKKDPKRAQMEVMALYREKGVNPLTGCFPILIQMPFLIGMFDLLKSTFELRGASFIPGWIDNLTAPDVLFSWKYPIFFVGNEFHLLPLLLGAVMYIQQKFSSNAPKDKTKLTDQQRQQKAMGNIMVIVFTVLFYNFPSGLNIYWLSSMLLGILQQWYMMKKLRMHASVERVS